MTLLLGDAATVLATLPEKSVQCCVTSPPYFGLRSYLGTDDPDKALEIGLDATPELYVQRLVAVFREVRRVLKDDGTVFLNLGDSYASGGQKTTGRNDPEKYGSDAGGRTAAGTTPGLKPKDLVGIPWRVAFALQADGWWLRSDIIWSKPNPMPESVTDRPTRSHEYIFLLTKSARYYYDNEAIKEKGAQNKWGKYSNPKYGDGSNGKMQSAKDFTKDEYLEKYAMKNKRSVWTVTTKPFRGAHFATFPPDLIEPCILAGSRVGDIVLDPFNGAGTTGVVSIKHNRDYIGIDLNPDYLEMSRKRFANVQPVMKGLP